MMHDFDGIGFLGMGYGMLITVLLIFLAGMAVGYAIGRSR